MHDESRRQFTAQMFTLAGTSFLGEKFFRAPAFADEVAPEPELLHRMK